MTNQQKAPVLVAASAEGHIETLPNNSTRLPPRLQRLLRALVANPFGLSREECDRVTPCSNSPQYIAILRQRFNLTISCHRHKFVTIDGLRGAYGVYQLTADDMTKLAAEGLV
ncbi:hypothetical protein [Pseudomonas sp. BMS12]|uniref:hypothetical protein n=1 Tax=Pseudomonas sp. BMS12 TaxID=1796033 RepID=UPI00083AC5E9|nr:hypothetical protein [Pseudomonas sp. BMS12]